jgi:hypothetical protein
MFQQFIAIIRGSYYLRSYSSNICDVDVYGLQFVQCGQLSRDGTIMHGIYNYMPETNRVSKVHRTAAVLCL